MAPATGSGRVPARVRPQTSQTYYHRNQQYSIVGLTNAAGTLVERYTYSAYGTLGIYAANGTVRTSSTYANRYTYTGREWDADLRLYHFRARWYDPATGGFVSRDPLGYVDGMSLYRGYFGVRGVDPSGTILVQESMVNDNIVSISIPTEDSVSNTDESVNLPVCEAKTLKNSVDKSPDSLYFKGTGIYLCTSDGLIKHSYCLTRYGWGYGFYAKSHLQTATTWEHVCTMGITEGVVSTDDHNAYPDADCYQLYLNPECWDVDCFASNVERRLMFEFGQNGQFMPYNVFVRNCHNWANSMLFQSSNLVGCEIKNRPWYCSWTKAIMDGRPMLA